MPKIAHPDAGRYDHLHGDEDMLPPVRSLDDAEKLAVAIIRTNAQEKKVEVRKVVQILRLRITYHWRSKKNFWGRFGGGWQWEIGVQVGWPTVILYCLIFSLRFELLPPPTTTTRRTR